MELKFVQHNSPDYKKAVNCRHEVLREPLNLAFSQEELAAESDQKHLVAIDGDAVLGCASLAPMDDGQLKMRQVAVQPQLQGWGIGSSLVKYAEDWARHSGFRKMILHARDRSMPFYEKLGYKAVGEGFTEIGIPHHKMVKDL